MDFSVKKAPPVPIKTYRWEDVRRDKQRGKYPYTYLYKNLLVDLDNMEDDKKPLVSAEDEKPADGEEKKPVESEKKKKKVVRKLKKTPKVDELTLKDKAKEEAEKVKEEIENSQKLDVVEVLPKAKMDTSRVSEQSEEKKSDKLKIEEMPDTQVDKPNESIHAAKEETEHLTITTETRDLSAERQTNEDKGEETISRGSERITTRQDSTDDMEIKYEPLVEDEPLDKTDKMSVDLSPDVISKSDSKNTESEDTYTESNIEQYLDKEEISKSVSDASGLEGATSVSDVEFTHDSKHDVTPSVSETPATLEVPQDLKRKHSGSSELTKSNLSLFEKMKNTKFKAPTFKIPKFKKLTFNKKGSKRVKHDPKEQKATTLASKSEVMLQKKKSESPVYIHIPLNPSPEDLEKERQEAMKSESLRRLAADTSDSSTDRLNDSKDTNGTLSSTIGVTASGNVGAKSTASKWKGLQSKTDKKSPPFKKKTKVTSNKKASPKSEKKTATTTTEKKTSPVTKKRGDSPVEYTYIPLKPSENETLDKPSSEAENPVDEAVNTKLITEQTEAPVVTKDDETTANEPVVKEKEEIITEVLQKSETKETQKPEIEIKQLPKFTSKPDEDKSKGAIKKKTDDKGKKIKDKTTRLTKDIKKLASKLKGVQKKTKRGGSKKSSLKSSPKPVSVEKTSPTSKKRGDSPVEYIFIPLKESLPDENPEAVSKVEDKSAVVEQESLESEKENPSTEAKLEDIPKDTTEAMDVDPTVKPEESSKTEDVTMTTVEKDPSPLPVAEEPMEVKTISTPTPIQAPAPVPAKTEMQKAEPKQVDDTKKPSFMSKFRGLKHKTEKKSPPAIKKGVKQFTSKKVSPKSPKKETASKKSSPPPSAKRSDSPVEYIYIPLKSPEPGSSQEQPIRTDDKTEETPMELKAPKRETPAVESMEINGTTTEEPVVTTNGDASVGEQEMPKFKGTQSKPEKKSPPTKKKKPGKGSPKMEKISASPKRDSPPVEYIYIPLTPVEGELDFKQRSVTPIRETADTYKPSEVDSKLEIQPKPKDVAIKQDESKNTDTKAEKVADKPKDNIMTKLKGLKPKKARAPKPNKELATEKRMSPPKAVQITDAPVKYIHIPLKSPESEETELKSEETFKTEESELSETKPMVEQMKTENVVEEQEREVKEETVESATVSEIVPQSSSSPSEEPKREKVTVESTEPVVSSVSAEATNTDETKVVPSSSPPIEEAERPKIHDNIEESRLIKESVLKKWQGFKTKPLQKPMPLKRKEPKMTSPKTEKKPAAPKSKDQPPVVVRREDSPVEYTYIPLNPTEEQLQFEREIEEQKRLAAPKPSSAARTPERSPKPTKKPATEEEDKPKKAAAKTGAIKKQPMEKGNKIKDTTTKLTEDIKKFASKLKDMQKKSKKPTFKTFKRGSKSGSKKMSPTTSKKLVSPVGSRSPPMPKPRGDSPVEYIFIPLKPSPEEEQFERELKEKREAEEKKAALSLTQPSTEGQPVTETVEKPTEVSRKPVIVEAIQKASKKEPIVKDTLETETATTPSASPFNSLKKTKEFSKNKLKTLKGAVQPAKEKTIETKVEKTVIKEKTVVTKKEKRDSPEYIFIPLKDTETTEEPVKETEKDVQEATAPIPDEIVEKIVEPVKKPPTPEEPHYEPLTTEDEEDGLKTAIIASLKEVKPSEEEPVPPLKSVLKAEDSPKMNKKVSFESLKVEEKENGLDKSKSGDENAIYETIQIKGENPDTGVAAARKLVTVPRMTEDTTLEDDHSKWSKSTLSKSEFHPLHYYICAWCNDVAYKMNAYNKSAKDFEETKKRLTQEIVPASSKKQKRSISEGGKPRDPSSGNLKRQSSSGSSREVRCACQFFQCDNPLPDRVNPVGTRPSSRLSHAASSRLGDHEYEPVNPPPEIDATPVSAASPPEAPRAVHVTDTDLEPPRHEVTDTAAQQQPLKDTRLLRIPLDRELVVPSANAEETISSDKSLASTLDRTDTPGSRRRLLERVIGTPDTSSRTDGISTSQVDSSALEHLPLKKESRQKPKMAQSEDQPPNIQEKIRNQAGRLKTKIKGMKRPTFTIPNPKFSPKFQRPKFQKPKLQRPKFEKPKFTMPKMPAMPSMPKMPKMPDRPKMSMPSFSLPRPGNLRRQQSADDRHISTTESSADSKKNNIFDFRTYPRLFDRSKKNKTSTNATASGESETPTPESATVPRAAARKKGPVGSRWVHRFTDIEYADEESTDPRQMYNVELHSKDRGDSLERRMEADLRYEEALAEADDDMREYERENQDINRHSPYIADSAEYADRWRHGNFRRQHHDEIDEFDNEMRNGVDHHTEDEMQQNIHDERSSVASSGSRRHRGVLEEIDSDQFFLREKGISQDNIQVGLYLSSEIRDAFRQPVNALSQMQNVQPGYGSRDYDLDASDLSLTRPSRPKRKYLKKTKRVKKTPHTSQEYIHQYDQESVNTETEEWSRDYNDYKTFPPARPRRNRKQPKNVVPDDEHVEADMPVDDEVNLNLENLKSQEDLPSGVDNESIPNILGYVDKDMDANEEYNKYLHDEALMYENEIMKDIQQPEIVISADQKYEIAQRDVDRYLENTGMVNMPKPPTRRHKSLKSLNLSEHDSIMGEFNKDRIMQDILEQELNVYRVEHEYMVPVDEPPVVPIRRTRSRSRTESQAEDDRTSRGAESLISECHEPPCVEDIRDCMGYAVIDKSKQQDPPLPSAPRRRRSTKSNKSTRSSDTKFFTVPRPLNDTPPARPQRNYSTLGPNRPPRRKSELDLSQTEEEKENIDVTQYIEIEDDDHNRDLQSGDVIKKMKGRPLPAPPRPPRKTRDISKEALRDITQETNIMSDSYIDEHDDKLTTGISPASPMEAVEEIEVSTQTDPLPDDFCCEDVIEEPTDRIVAPTRRKRSIHHDTSTPRSTERPKTPLERSVSPNAMIIERRVQTPIEDVTHASLLVRPVPEYPPDSYVSKRFAADIPDIFSASVIPQPSDNVDEPLEEPVVEEEIIKETKPEPERKAPTPIYSEISKQPKEQIVQDEDVDEPSVIPTELLELFSQPPAASIETDVTLSSKQTETVTLEQRDEVAEMPEKPQRRRSQAQVQSTIKPEVPPTPVSPPVSPQPQIIERIIERQVPVCITPGPDTEVEVLKAHRLQVTDLDVERLNVTELQAQKILVSEIDGVTLQISELTSKSGNLVVNGLEIPSGLLQEILERLQPAAGEPSPSVEQVSTQTNIEDIRENTETNKLAEPANVEQIGTQTSIELQDEVVPPPVMEPVSTQTSLDEPDVLPTPPVMEQVATQTSVEEPDDSNVPDLVLASPEREIATASPIVESAQSPPVQIVEDVHSVEEEEDQHNFTPAQLMELQGEIDDIIDTACEQISRDTAYMNEMLLDSLRYEVPDQFSPTMSDEIIIDLPGHVIIETEDPITGETIFFQQPLDERLPMEFREMIQREMELEREEAAKQQSVLLTDSPQLMDIPEEEELREDKTEQRTESPIDDSEVPKEFTELKDKEELLIDAKPEEVEIKEEIVQQQDSVVPTELKELKDEEEALIELLTVNPDEAEIKEKQQIESSVTTSKSDVQEAKAEEHPKRSIVPKEFRELKDEQEAIIDQLQKEIEKTQELLKKEMNIKMKEIPETKAEDTEKASVVEEVIVKEVRSVPVESSPRVPPAIPPLPKEHLQRDIMQEVIAAPFQSLTQQETTKSQEVSEQTESSSAQSNTPPSRPPLPQQDNVHEPQAPVQMIQDMAYPISYYPEYIHSVPPQSFYTLRSPQPRDLSEDDIPVHHRRRRHHRHMSRSSSDEDRRTVARRTRASSADPSIPQLTGQLAKACTISAGRVIKQMTNYITSSSNVLTRQQLQVVMVILLVLIAGLILMGLSAGKTVHLHHWEYFNPPKEL